MNLKNLRIFLWAALFLSSAFAAWSWFRPYEWNPDAGARCEVVGVQVTRDRSYFWVEPHLKIKSGMTHDLQKPIRLVTAAGHELEPADTTFGGTDGKGTTDIWLKFWLEEKDLTGPLSLQINDGKLSIRKNNGLPGPSGNRPEYHVSNQW